MDGQAWISPATAALIGYLLGSIPFGLLLTRAAGGGDLRTIGSGNIGATNVLRTGRKGLAAATLLLDALKGAAAIGVAMLFVRDPADLLLVEEFAAAGAFLGHLFPIWLGFRGGKGVATYLGIATALYWPCGLVFAIVWLAAMALSRYSSVGGMAAAVATPVAAATFGRFELVILLLCLTVLVLVKHGGNIARLLDGTEPRIGSRRAEMPEA